MYYYFAPKFEDNVCDFDCEVTT